MPEPFWYGVALAVTWIAGVSAQRCLARWRTEDSATPDVVPDSLRRLAPYVSFILGLAILGIVPRWPPASAMDRLLTWVLPGTLGLSFVLASDRRAVRVEELIRGLGAVACCWTLLQGSVYLRADTPEGSAGIGWYVLGMGGWWLWAEWSLMSRLVRRENDPLVPLTLGVAILAAGLTILLAGYIRGGAVSVPLGGAVAASVFARGSSRSSRVIRESATDLGMVGLFGLLVIGRFFGGVTTGQAMLLFASPMLIWYPSRWQARRSTGWWIATRLTAFAIPIAIVLVWAFLTFQRKFQPLL